MPPARKTIVDLLKNMARTVVRNKGVDKLAWVESRSFYLDFLSCSDTARKDHTYRYGSLPLTEVLGLLTHALILPIHDLLY